MGQKDLSEKNLEFFPDVFADTVNALLYEGEPVVDPNTLKPAPTETLYYSQNNKLRNQFQDVSKYQMQGNSIHLQYTLENETKANRKMLFRRIGYEGAAYREQWDRKETFPFIGLVLYWGEREWRPPRSIAEFFHNRKIPLETWTYINDFHMHVYEMARLPKHIRDRFQSDMRFVVDILAEGENYIPNVQPIRHKEALFLMLTSLTEDERFEEILNQMEEDYIRNHPDEYANEDEYDEKGDQKTMKTFLDRYYRESVAQGLTQGLTQGLSQGTLLGAAQNLTNNVEALMQNLSLSLQEACASINSTVEEYQNAKERTQQGEYQETFIPASEE